MTFRDTSRGLDKIDIRREEAAMTAPLSSDSASGNRQKTSLKALLPLLPYALQYRGRIFAALIALILASGSTLAIPLAVRRMIDYGFSAEGAGLIDKYFAMMIVVVTILAAASASRYYLVMTLGERVVADIRTAVFDHLTRLDAGFYDTVKSGEIVSRLSADTTQLKSAFGASASVALRNLVLFIGAGGMMVYTSPRLSGLVALAIPIIVLPLVASGRSVRQRSRLAQDRLADASAYATEAIGAMRVMQAFVAEHLTLKRFSDAAEEAYETARIATRARSLLTGIAITLVFQASSAFSGMARKMCLLDASLPERFRNLCCLRFSLPGDLVNSRKFGARSVPRRVQRVVWLNCLPSSLPSARLNIRKPYPNRH